MIEKDEKVKKGKQRGEKGWKKDEHMGKRVDKEEKG